MITFAPLDKQMVKVGMRVQDRYGLTGTVKWFGEIDKKSNPLVEKGKYVGIEFDESSPSPLRNDGKWGNKRYFTCDPGKGGFLKPKMVYPEVNPTVVADLRQRYGDKVADWHDFELVKFCIARNFDMQAVYTMLEKHFEWLEEFKPSYDEYFPDSMCEDYPCGYGGTCDYDNNIIYCERPCNAGKLTANEYMERYSPAAIMRWHACAMEMGKKILKESNYKYKRVCYIVDLTNVGLSTSRSLISFGRTIASVDQANYPEHLGRLFLVNCPKVFTLVWKLLRFFIDAETNRKVHFVPPGDGLKYLKQFMPEEAIPDFAGGSSTAWRSKGTRVGSTDPLNAFKGVTVFQAVASDGIPERFDDMDEEGLSQEEKKSNNNGRLGSSGSNSEDGKVRGSSL
ncbi:cytosolic factor SEC14, putative,phosphatidylinositol/phosphatidylcholine transfer protein, putative [Trypanosoma cruzi marinkellei]|uniref:Cytosolic factor SEC14, putative,phosphatidylinositol/phosphatidylcholine transfer protein, putative n=1 Tax=Trypanosoma cruzi marinkellei TaxID=85056 RepID=K2MQ55_TRYCR|nr:cytosolic factor SEC14, putative,phosphatidylinositol/phosphatidylcholine transfer protein, putative [Trypanosoma cruzi marinkellei]